MCSTNTVLEACIAYLQICQLSNIVPSNLKYNTSSKNEGYDVRHLNLAMRLD